MFKLIRGIFSWLRGGSLKLLSIAGIILLVWGIVSPVGTLVWWLRQGSESLGLKKNRPKSLLPSNSKVSTLNTTGAAKSAHINCYIIFLPGVGDFSANELTTGEEYFLRGLLKIHPNCVAVGDVFPYSVANESLGGQRLLAPVWRFAHQAKGGLAVADVLVKIRNLWRFAISADHRYGPVYSQGIANAIIERMNAKHPLPQKSSQPLNIILVGTSGGVQVSLGAANYLQQRLDAKITVLSIGGAFNGRTGFNATNHFYHLRGQKDWIEDIAGVVFPSRWLWNIGSEYNQARQQGKYTPKISGSHEHDGSKGYFGEDIAGPNKITYVDLTLQEVNKLPIWEIKDKQKTVEQKN